MSAQGHSCVRQALIGTTLSEFTSIYRPQVADHIVSRTRAKLVNGEIQVAGDQWPVFLYADYSYNPEDPWNGLLCSGLLVVVRSPLFFHFFADSFHKAFKHTFTSPSSVDQEPKATRSGNAHLHGMWSMMKASITYIATQVRYYSLHSFTTTLF